MFNHTSLIASAVLFVAMQSSAYAAEKCYEETVVPASSSCAKNGSKSADFSSGCQYSPQTIEKKVVSCPATWVNADGQTSQAKACAAEGLKPADFDGQRCASGEWRPISGENYQNINYRYGKYGSGGGKGGSTAQLVTRTWTSGSGQEETYIVYYCWNPRDTRDNDGTDLAVAYACKP